MSDDNRSMNGTVMIVDDTPGNLALLSDTLSDAHYRVLVATDGLSAIEQMQYLKPDIILMDVVMPGIDGFETCRRIKADPATAGIPILFMTGLSELDHLLQGFGEGGLDYIIKPIRPPEVLARIEVHLTQSRNILRAQQALQQSAYSALAIDRSGCISWLTAPAETWLHDFMRHYASQQPIGIGSLLPSPLLEWFRQRLSEFRQTSEECFEHYRSSSGFTVKMTHCRHLDEYLLLLQKESTQWNLESLRESLKLTFREAEILMWISRGKTNKEVGLILGSSPRTINKHLEHIFEKLGVATRAAAVAMVLQR
jgi:CheY-like chemotaxis protein/DNA-binding CsgD family transcriptional regulator